MTSLMISCQSKQTAFLEMSSATNQNKENKTSKKRVFGDSNEEDKGDILRGRKAENTNKATECHVKLLRDYLVKNRNNRSISGCYG